MTNKLVLKIHAAGRGRLSTIRSIAAELVWAIRDAFPESEILYVTEPEGTLGTIMAVGDGSADLCISFPLAAQWAVDDRFHVVQGEFKKKIKNIRALASLSLFSLYPFAVREETGIKSIEDIRDRKFPLRLLTTPVLEETSYSAAAVKQVLSAYDISTEDIKSWGGKFLGRSWRDCKALKNGKADGVFCEVPPYTTWMFYLAAHCNLRFLPLSDDALKHLYDAYGHPRAVIYKGFWRGVQEDMQTIGRFNSLVIVRDDMADKVAYDLAKLIKEVVSPRLPKHIPGGYLSTHTPDYVCTGTGIPLHPGAESYYREAGLKPTLEVPADPEFWRQRFENYVGGF